ncbi:MAG: phosphonoacetaldehyde reductase [Clostridiales bacterium]|nr:phosphonoacetaldehyde reductase [Clostridiales bacterium]
MDYKEFCSTEIVFADLQELKTRLEALEYKNITFVMSESSAQRWVLLDSINEVRKNCKNLGNDFVWLKDIAANPNQSDVLLALEQIDSKRIDVIIAIGGGSALDLAKAVSAFYKDGSNNPYTVSDITNIIQSKKYPLSGGVDIIGIPSTAGTGSELTQWATIWDIDGQAKYSIDHPRLKPVQALIVPELTYTLPADLTLSTGLDAMAQAIEAYWSKHTNPLVQDLAFRAVELVMTNLKQAIENMTDAKAREGLCRASVLAGLAFSQTRTTACHSISYPLTMLHNVPHGLAASITLDGVGRLNKRHFENDEKLFELFSTYGGIMNWIDWVSKGVQIMRLSAFGIKQEDIVNIVDRAFTGGRMDNNPVDLSKKDVEDILIQVL